SSSTPAPKNPCAPSPPRWWRRRKNSPPENPPMSLPRAAWLICVLVASTVACAADYPKPHEGDAVLRDFKFRSGESLAELRLHYHVVGRPQRDAAGVVRNAVLIMHGTGGAGKNLLRAEFAGELFGAGQPLDATKFFIVLPDAIGSGQSSKPSDGLRAKFPRY